MAYRCPECGAEECPGCAKPKRVRRNAKKAAGLTTIRKASIDDRLRLREQKALGR